LTAEKAICLRFPYADMKLFHHFQTADINQFIKTEKSQMEKKKRLLYFYVISMDIDSTSRDREKNRF